jgi:hypothetical protein
MSLAIEFVNVLAKGACAFSADAIDVLRGEVLWF